MTLLFGYYGISPSEVSTATPTTRSGLEKRQKKWSFIALYLGSAIALPIKL